MNPIGPVRALVHARGGIATIALTYAVSLGLGMGMVHAGNPSALRFRDALVARAHRADPAALADDAGDHGRAAVIDFARNLGMAAIPETVGGLTIVMPVLLAGYRGWVGGIVSVDSHHHSRLAERASARYYLVTLLLQLVGFTLAGGGGIHLGWSYLRRRGPFVGPSWFSLPRPALVDVAWLYTLIVPFMAVGSLWEYFAPGR